MSTLDFYILNKDLCDKLMSETEYNKLKLKYLIKLV